MKANEFVKKFGLELAKRDVAALASGFIKREDFLEHYGFDILNDLKRLVESHELVALFDDINCAKSWVSDLDGDWPYQVKGADTKFFKWQLEQAIADVESCM